MCDAHPATYGTRKCPLLGFRNYLNNYFAMYKRVTPSRLHVQLASVAYVGLGIT